MSILLSGLFITFLIFLIVLGIVLIGYAIEDGAPEGVALSIFVFLFMFLFAGFLSIIVPLSSETKIEPVEAEMAHNIMYVKYGDIIKEFPKLADTEYFKNNKEAKITVLYDMWGDRISTIIETP